MADKLARWRCEFCGDLPPDADVQEYGDGHCHVVPVQVGYDDWEPQPCGPVSALPISEE